MSEEILTFGKAIEFIKNDIKVTMYRKAWHGVQLGKKMGCPYILKGQEAKGTNMTPRKSFNG